MAKIFTLTLILFFPFVIKAQIFNPSDATVCKGGNTSFKSGSIYPAPTYLWQFRHKGVWYDLTSNAPFSGITSTTLNLTGTSDTLSNDSFRCKVYFNSALVGISKGARLTVNGGSTVPSSTSATVNPVSCPGGSTQLTVSGGYLSPGSAWRWYTVGCGKVPLGGNTANPDSTTTYYVRAEGACGDTTSCVTLTVTVTNKNSVAAKSISATNDSICAGASSALSAIGGSLGTGAKWKWYTGGTCSVVLDTSGVSSIAVSPLSTTAYSVKAEGKCGSTACKSITITVNQLPTVNAGNDTFLCKGFPIRLNASVSGNNTYSWTPAAGLDNASIKNPNANPATTTIYVLSVKDNGTKCIKTDSVKVTVKALPVAKVNKDTAICKGGKAKLLASGGIKYVWNPSAALDFPNTANPTSSAVINTKYKVIVTDQYKCSDTGTVNITVNALPKINLTSDTFICEGQSIKLHAEDGVTYSWTPTSSLNASNIAEPIATPSVKTNYQVTVTNTYSCTATGNVLVDVKINPGSSPTALKVTICQGDGVILKVIHFPKADTYSWKPRIGLSNPDSSSTFVFPKATSTYTVDLGLNGCVATDTFIVYVLNSPPPVFTVIDSVVCKNATWASYCVTPSANGFSWKVQNGTIMSGQGTNCIYVHWSSAVTSGTVIVKDSLKSTPACPVIISKNIIINGGPAPQPVKVLAKGGNISSGILFINNASFGIYEWGYEGKATGVEQKTCSGDTFCNYSGGIDTLGFDYWVKVGNDQTCLTKSYFNGPNANVGVNTLQYAPRVTMRPNPVLGELVVESNANVLTIFIYDLLGKIVHVPISLQSDNQWMLDMGGLVKGIYLVRIQTESGLVVRKVVKG